MLICKLNLIVIESCMANRQILGSGNSNMGHRRPPVYRSSDPAKFWTKKSAKRP